VVVCRAVIRPLMAGDSTPEAAAGETVDGVPAWERVAADVVPGEIRDGPASPLAPDRPGRASATAADRKAADTRAPAAIHRVARETERRPASRSNSFLTSFKYEGPIPRGS
jgi:hypothetical protein